MANRWMANRWMLFQAWWSCKGGRISFSLNEHQSASYHPAHNRIMVSRWMLFQVWWGNYAWNSLHKNILPGQQPAEGAHKKHDYAVLPVVETKPLKGEHFLEWCLLEPIYRSTLLISFQTTIHCVVVTVFMYSYHIMVVLIGYQRNLFILELLDDLYVTKVGGGWD